MERSSLDQQLSEDVAMLRDTVRSFAAEQIAPRHEVLDHAAEHPSDVVAAMAELGLLGILVPAESGGVGMGMLAHLVAVDELAAAGGLAGAILCAHGIACDALAQSAAADRVPALLGGTLFAAPALGAGDWKAGAGGSLSGSAAGVPFPGRAGVFVVLATDAAGRALFAVDADAKGLRHGGVDDALGLLGFETATLTLRDTPATRIGGADVVARVLASARAQVAALLCGIGRGAVVHAVRYAHERKQFDRPLIDFTAMQERLARAAARAEAARGLAFGAARLRDAGHPWAIAAARARLVAAEAALAAADDALQVFGGYGYSREYPAERFYRDARFLGFGEGDPAALVTEIARDL